MILYMCAVKCVSVCWGLVPRRPTQQAGHMRYRYLVGAPQRIARWLKSTWIIQLISICFDFVFASFFQKKTSFSNFYIENKVGGPKIATNV